MINQVTERISGIKFLYEVRDSSGQSLTDKEIQSTKDADWKAVRKVAAKYSPALVKKFFAVAEKADGITNHTDLNRLESEELGSIQTKGPWVRRKRFWKFMK